MTVSREGNMTAETLGLDYFRPEIIIPNSEKDDLYVFVVQFDSEQTATGIRIDVATAPELKRYPLGFKRPDGPIQLCLIKDELFVSTPSELYSIFLTDDFSVANTDPLQFYEGSRISGMTCLPKNHAVVVDIANKENTDRLGSVVIKGLFNSR